MPNALSPPSISSFSNLLPQRPLLKLYACFRGSVFGDTGCLTCRRRRVKCDEQRPNCGACFRLDMQCHWKPEQNEMTLNEHPLPMEIGGSRKRVRRACEQCRRSKLRCSAERPTCSNCRGREDPCRYDQGSSANGDPPDTTSFAAPKHQSTSPLVASNTLLQAPGEPRHTAEDPNFSRFARCERQHRSL